MKQIYYSHGKLLLTGEYFVLDGARALGLPCKLGQSLEVKLSDQKGISWVSYDVKNERWFQKHYTIENITQIPTNNPRTIAETLQKILHVAYCKNPFFFKEIAVECHTKLEFPRDWGLGSSSTLIHNIALWTGIDAYELLENSFGGSGYDIAAAKSKMAFIYQRYTVPKSQEVELNWNFTDRVFFVHRNQKQDSKEGISRYRSKAKQTEKLHEINKLTQDFTHAKTLEQLEVAIEKHENLVATHIGLKPIKEELFPDYPYAIKSLGAWGGDFFMALGGEKEKIYFREKGYITIIPYSEMVF